MGGWDDYVEYLPTNNSDWEYVGEKPVNGINCHFWQQKSPLENPRNWTYQFFASVDSLRPVRYLSLGQRNLHTHPTDYAFDIDEWGPTIDPLQFYIPPDCPSSTEPRYERGIFPKSEDGRFVPQIQPFCANDTSTSAPDLPGNFSWRAVPNVLPPVRDQAICGSCWSQGSSEAVSAQISMRLNKSVEVSAQQVVDCAWGGPNFACDGGSTWSVYHELASKNIPIVSEADYPYIGVGGYCPSDYADKLGYVLDPDLPCTQFRPDRHQDRHELLKAALYIYGPLAVSIHSGEEQFMELGPENPYYSNQNCNSNTWTRNICDHIVLLTGWQSLNRKSYLEIQNSWSTRWGADGFGYIDEDYDCGIEAMAVLPHVKKVWVNN
jgi:C1A family cysteine protease